MPALDPGNLIQGVGYVYRAPLGTTEPVKNTMHLAPSSPWENLGFTEGGVSLALERDWQDLTVDQITDIVERRMTQRSLQFETSFAEPTLTTFHHLNNAEGAITAVAGGAGAAAGSSYQPDAGLVVRPTYCMIIVDGFAPLGFARRILIRRALVIENIESEYQKEDKTVFGVTIASHYVSASVRPFEFLDQTAIAV